MRASRQSTDMTVILPPPSWKEIAPTCSVFVSHCNYRHAIYTADVRSGQSMTHHGDVVGQLVTVVSCQLVSRCSIAAGSLIGSSHNTTHFTAVSQRAITRVRTFPSDTFAIYAKWLMTLRRIITVRSNAGLGDSRALPLPLPKMNIFRVHFKHRDILQCR